MRFSFPKMAGAAGALVLALVVALPVFAHHGWSWTREAWFELSGTVTDVYVGQPHATLEIESDGQTWHVDLAPLARTLDAGFNEDVVAEGDSVTVIGHRAIEDGVFEMKAVRVIVGGQAFDVYPGRASDYDAANS